MRFTINVPDKTFKAIQKLADRHRVKPTKMILVLVRRGLISGHFVPFRCVEGEAADMRALARELAPAAREAEKVMGELMGIDISKMSIEELSELASGDGPTLAIAEKFYPGVPLPESWRSPLDLYQQLDAIQAEMEREDALAVDRELEEALAALPGDDELEAELDKLGD